MIHVCTATTRDSQAFQQTPTWKSLSNRPDIAWHIVYQNTEGLSKVYNKLTEEVLAQANNSDVLLYIHDDVYVDCHDLSATLTEGLKRFDIVGLAGSTKFTVQEPATWWSNSPKDNWSGCVAHRPREAVHVSFFGPYGEVVVLDGLFIATQVKLLHSHPTLRWGEYLTGFHHYDLDFTLKAHSMGFTLGTIHCPVVHSSMGDFKGLIWEHSQTVFLKHWRG